MLWSQTLEVQGPQTGDSNSKHDQHIQQHSQVISIFSADHTIRRSSKKPNVVTMSQAVNLPRH